MNIKWFLANLGLSSAQKELLNKVRELFVYNKKQANQEGYTMAAVFGFMPAGHISTEKKRRRSEEERQDFINQCRLVHIASWRVSLALWTR